MQGKGEDKVASDIEEIHQLVSDFLFGILRDWAHISAGQSGPWTRTETRNFSPNILLRQLNSIEIKRIQALVQGDIYGGINRPLNTQSASENLQMPNAKMCTKFRKTFGSSFLTPVLQAGKQSINQGVWQYG